MVLAETDDKDNEVSGQYNEAIYNEETFQNTTNDHSYTFWNDIEKRQRQKFKMAIGLQ